MICFVPEKTNWSSKPPSNWPSDIPFEDPNNPKKNDKKFYKKDVLLRMMNGFVENYTVKKFLIRRILQK